MSQNDLISKIKLLQAIKPNSEWKKITEEKLLSNFKENYEKQPFFIFKPVYALVSFFLLVIIGSSFFVLKERVADVFQASKSGYLRFSASVVDPIKQISFKIIPKELVLEENKEQNAVKNSQNNVKGDKSAAENNSNNISDVLKRAFGLLGDDSAMTSIGENSDYVKSQEEYIEELRARIKEKISLAEETIVSKNIKDQSVLDLLDESKKLYEEGNLIGALETVVALEKVLSE